MAFFEIPHSPGRRLHYEVVENVLPETTLFLHGNLASNRWWTPARKIWQQNSKGQNFKGHMILAEFRGCGQSSAPADLSEVKMDLFAQDFLALLKNLKFSPGAGSAALGPVNVVGHSTGGLIAALMAAIEPSAIRRLVLLDPVGARGVKFEASMTAAFETMKVDRALTAAVIGSTILNNDPETAYFQNEIVEDAYLAVKNVGAWVLQSLDGLDISQQLRFVKAPTLVLHGQLDLLLPKADSQEIAQLMSGSFQELPGCGHCANVENPGMFVEVADSFLFHAK